MTGGPSLMRSKPSAPFVLMPDFRFRKEPSAVKTFRRLTALILGLGLILGTTPAPAEAAMPAAYGEILDLVRRSMAGDKAATDDPRFNVCWYSMPASGQDIGYTLTDLDGDGADELILGLLADSPEDENWLTDIWTVRGGEAARVAAGWERSRLYLTLIPDEAGIFCERSDTVFESMLCHARIKAGCALLDEQVLTVRYNWRTHTFRCTLDGAEIGIEEATRLTEAWRLDLWFPELLPLRP